MDRRLASGATLFSIQLGGALLIAGAASGAPPASPAPPPMVVTTCASCHDLSLVLASRHDRADWARIIERMKQNGATFTDAEGTAVLDYLSVAQGLSDAPR